MIYVLYKNSGVYSGRALRKALQSQYKSRISGGYPKHYIQTVRKGVKPSLVVNLGTTDTIDFRGRTLNNREMVRSAANKRAARRIFAEALVPAPAFYEGLGDLTPRSFPLIARTSYHSKGKGLWFCANMADAQKAIRSGATHFLQFIPNTREYRVHTFVKSKHILSPKEDRGPESYVSIKVSEKVWTGKGAPRNTVQKNHEFGWSFLGPKDRREEELDLVRQASKEAIAALGMDFGAVDVMYSIARKQAYVLEVNSTPSLADDNADTCERYAERISRIASDLETVRR